jgi:glycosyltransferase involved in cell wall biosynthesis
MKVSVIISTYNRAEKLDRAIQSVINQTYKDWELIIVDDKSTDSTNEMLYMKWVGVDPRIHCFKMKKNFGNDTQPKNKGILLSKGEYIAFLDDDNTWRPDHLQALVNEMEKYDDVDLVYGDRWIVFEDKSQPNRRGVAEDFHFGVLGDHNYIDTSDVLVRREALFAVGGFDERYKKFIDWNLWWRMEKYGFYFKRVPLLITDYYIHEDMKSLRIEDSKGQGVPAWDPVETEVVLPYLGEKKEPRVAIFSLVYDRPEYTEKCFDSLYKTAGYPFEHFIVAQTPNDATLIKKLYPKAHIIENKENVGISKGSNQALDAIKSEGLEILDSTEVIDHPHFDIIVKVDPDCLFITPNWLKEMVRIYKSNHKIALSCYIQGLKENPGGAPREFYGYLFEEHVQLGFSKHLGGICHFVSGKAYEDFRWDEHSFLHGAQDLELSMYLNSRGYAMAYLENYFAEHINSTSGQQKDYPDYFERRKWEKSHKYEAHK